MKTDKKSFTTRAQILKKELKNPRVKESYDYEGFASRIVIKIARNRKRRKKR